MLEDTPYIVRLYASTGKGEKGSSHDMLRRVPSLKTCKVIGGESGGPIQTLCREWVSISRIGF